MNVQVKTQLQPIPDRVFGPITRAMLALYAGASGDHNPIHIDIDYAKGAGLPDVFAHGMLSLGILASVVNSWVSKSELISINTRFLSITKIGDVITCHAEIIDLFEAEGVPNARLKLTATAQDGRPTLAGEAIVVLRG